MHRAGLLAPTAEAGLDARPEKIIKMAQRETFLLLDGQ